MSQDFKLPWCLATGNICLRLLVGLSLLAMSASTTGAEQPSQNAPVSGLVPAEATTPEQFIPSGWQIDPLARERGLLKADFNSDGLTDCALIVSPKQEDSQERLLVIAFGEPGGKFKLNTVNNKFIMTSDRGVVPGLCVLVLQFNEGTLQIDQASGSQTACTVSHKFHYMNQQWQLAGIEWHAVRYCDGYYLRAVYANVLTGYSTEDTVSNGRECIYKYYSMLCPRVANAAEGMAQPATTKLASRRFIQNCGCRWRSAADLSASIRCFWSVPTVTFCVDVTDNKVVPGDTVQVFHPGLSIPLRPEKRVRERLPNGYREVITYKLQDVLGVTDPQYIKDTLGSNTFAGQDAPLILRIFDCDDVSGKANKIMSTSRAGLKPYGSIILLPGKRPLTLDNFGSAWSWDL
jgi:hypothetical protein